MREKNYFAKSLIHCISTKLNSTSIQLNKFKFGISSLLMVCLMNLHSFAGVPTIGTISGTNINMGTGINHLLVQISNGGDGNQAITNVTASSSNSAVLSVVGVSTFTGTLAVVRVLERGTVGNATLTINVTDADGTTPKAFNMSVGRFYRNGATYSLFDMVFWARVNPTDQSSLADTLLTSLANIPNDVPGGFFDRAELTVGAGTSPPHGTKKGSFYTSTFRGVFVPTVTGLYFIRLTTQDNREFQFYTGPNRTGPVKARGLLNPGNPNATPPIPTTGNFIDTTYLIANQPYAFQATAYVVFSDWMNFDYAIYSGSPGAITSVGGVGFTVPGLTYNPIAGGLIYPYYDTELPQAPSNLVLQRKGSTVMDIKWRKASDNNQVSLYRIYADGQLIATKSGVKDTTVRLRNLSPNRLYSVVVTAVDLSGNESAPSNILVESTFPSESTPPTPPNTPVAVQLGDMSVLVTWTGASDALSGIFGYRIYNNGVLYNKDTLNANSAIIKTLQPETPYAIEIEAIDGNGNVSATKSSPLMFTTLAFNPLVTSPGVKKARMNITADYIGRNEGIGINGEWENSNFDKGNSLAFYNEYRPGLMRWGTLGANTWSFSSRSGAGATNGVSYAKFINFATSKNAYVSIAIGTDGTPIIDWRDDPEGTAAKFYYYLASTATGIGNGVTQQELDQANKRRNEGFNQNLVAASRGIIIECGNEPWGGTSLGNGVDHNADQFNNYVIYRQWCRRIARGMKSARGYDSTKIWIAYSGREPSPSHSYGLTETMFQGTATDPDMLDMVSLGGYLGGNLNYVPGLEKGESEVDYYRSGWYKMDENLKGFQETMDIDYEFTGKIRPIFLYESAMTRPDYNKRLGQAVVLHDYLTQSMKHGNVPPGVFAWRGGEWGITSEDYAVKFPMFDIGKHLNYYTKGNILNYTSESLEVPTGLSGSSKVKLNRLDAVGMNAYHENGVYKLLFFSRDFENDYQVQVNLPEIGNSTTGQQWIITGSDFSSFSTNITSTGISISDNMIVTVPKHGVVIITFGGINLPNIPLPLGYTKYKKPTGLGILDLNEPGLAAPLELNYFVTFAGSSRAMEIDYTISSSGDVDFVEQTGITTINGVVGRFITLTADQCTGGDVSVTLSAKLKDDPNIPAATVVTQITCDPNSVTKAKTAEQVKVYPNPSAGTVSIQSKIGGQIQITDLQGREVKRFAVDPKQKEIVLTLEPGVYIITNTNGTTSVTQKVVVTR